VDAQPSGGGRDARAAAVAGRCSRFVVCRRRLSQDLGTAEAGDLHGSHGVRPGGAPYCLPGRPVQADPTPRAVLSRAGGGVVCASPHEACRPRGVRRPVRTSRDQKLATSRPWSAETDGGTSAGAASGNEVIGTVGGWVAGAPSAGESSPICPAVGDESPEMIPARPRRYVDVMVARAMAWVEGCSVSPFCWTRAGCGRCGPPLTGEAFTGQRLTVRRFTATLIGESMRSGGGLPFLPRQGAGRELSDRETEGAWWPLSLSGSAVASSRSPVEQRALSQVIAVRPRRGPPVVTPIAAGHSCHRSHGRA
jgi:hypothetical protein